MPMTMEEGIESGWANGEVVEAEKAVVMKKGQWTMEEDEKLRKCVEEYGVGNWIDIEKYSGLSRSSKSCRLRWTNHLRPNLKKGAFTYEEERIIVKMHYKYGNKWSQIAKKLPGRTDNEIKNFWHSRVKKCKKLGIPMYPAYATEEETSSAEILNKNSNNENDDNHSNKNAAAAGDVKLTNHKCEATNDTNHRLESCIPDFQLSSNYQPNTTHSPIQPPTHSPQIITSSSPHQQGFMVSCQGMPTSHSTPNSLPPQTQCSLSSSPRQSTTRAPVSNLPAQSQSQMQQPTGIDTSTPIRPAPDVSSSLGESKQFPRAPGRLSFGGHTSSASALSTQMLPLPPPNLNSPTSVNSFSAFQSNSPTTGSVSPLKLHLSIPESQAQSSSLTADPLLSSPQVGSYSCLDMPHIQHISGYSSVTSEPPSVQFSSKPISKTEHNLYKDKNSHSLEILDTLIRETHAKVRLLRQLKRKSLLSKTPGRNIPLEESLMTKSFSTGNMKTMDLAERFSTRDASVSKNSEHITKECSLDSSSRAKDLIQQSLRVNRSMKNSRMKDFTKNILKKKGTLSDISILLERDNSSGESCLPEQLPSQIPQADERPLGERWEPNASSLGEKQNSLTSQEQRNIDENNPIDDQLDVDAWHGLGELSAGGFLGECSSTDGSLNKSPISLHFLDNYLAGDIFGQRFTETCPLASPHSLPILNEFCPFYSESTATPSLKYGDAKGKETQNSGASFLGETSNVQSVLASEGENTLPELSMVLPQHATTHPFAPADCPGGTPNSLQIPGGEFSGEHLSTGCNLNTGMPCETSSDQGMLIERVWSGGLPAQNPLPDECSPTFSQSAMTHLLELSCWNCDSVSTPHSAGLEAKQQISSGNMDALPEELTSLLEFFPGAAQIPDWHCNSATFSEMQFLQEFNMSVIPDTSIPSPAPL